jgi:hypothetical protein
MKRPSKFILLVTIFLLVACGPSAEELEATSVAETAAAASPTPAPTATPLPTPTATPIPYDLTVRITDQEGNLLEAALVSAPDQDLEESTNTSGEVMWNDLRTDTLTLDIYAQGYLPTEETVSLERGSNSVVVQVESDPFGLQLADVLEEGEELLFIEDFQDSEDGFYDLLGNWEIIEAEDEPGNMVIHITSDTFSIISFGPDEILEDFIVEYKFRFIELVPFTGSEWQTMGFEFWNRYSVSLHPQYGGYYQLIDLNVDPWEFPIQVNRSYKIGRWYTVRVEVTEPEVNLFLNDSRIGRYRDLKEATEGMNDLVALYAMEHVTGQFDDIYLKIPAP